MYSNTKINGFFTLGILVSTTVYEEKINQISVLDIRLVGVELGLQNIFDTKAFILINKITFQIITKIIYKIVIF